MNRSKETFTNISYWPEYCMNWERTMRENGEVVCTGVWLDNFKRIHTALFGQEKTDEFCKPIDNYVPLNWDQEKKQEEFCQMDWSFEIE